MEDDSNGSEITPEDELELYLKTGKKDDDDPGTLLEWWKTKASLFPRLAILAKRVLAIPATSANSERNFSRAGIIVNDKRSQISPENVDHSLVIHNYFLVCRKWPILRVILCMLSALFYSYNVTYE